MSLRSPAARTPVRDPRSVGRKHRVALELCLAGQRAHAAGGDIQQMDLRLVVIAGMRRRHARERDRSPVGRPRQRRRGRTGRKAGRQAPGARGEPPASPPPAAFTSQMCVGCGAAWIRKSSFPISNERLCRSMPDVFAGSSAAAKAILVPSGDQAKCCTPVALSVTRRASPPAIAITNTCGFGSRPGDAGPVPGTRARRRPATSAAARPPRRALVSVRCEPDAISTSTTSASNRFSSTFARDTTTAICFAVGRNLRIREADDPAVSLEVHPRGLRGRGPGHRQAETREQQAFHGNSWLGEAKMTCGRSRFVHGSPSCRWTAGVYYGSEAARYRGSSTRDARPASSRNREDGRTVVPALVRWMMSAAAPGRDSTSARPRVGAEHADCGVEPVGVEAVPCDDGDRDVVDETHPGRRVDDVGVAAPVDVHVLLAVAGCRDRRVGQLQHRGDADDRRIARVDADAPAALPGRRLAEREIAAHRHQRAAHAEPAQHLDRLAGGVALADAADVQRHAGHVERHGPMRGVQVELAEAAAAGGFLQRGGIGHARGLPRFAPEPDHGSLRDIERAAGRLRQLLRRGEDREQILADRHRATDAGPGDLDSARCRDGSPRGWRQDRGCDRRRRGTRRWPPARPARRA